MAACANENISAPRHVFVVLQNASRTRNIGGGDSLQYRSHMIFDKCNVNEVSMGVSNQAEPTEQLILDYGNNQIGRVYHWLGSYIGRDQNISTGISHWDFNELYLVYYFSLQHLDLSKHLTVDVKFQARIDDAFSGFRVIAVILSDKSMTLEGGGEIIQVIDAPVENV